MNDNDKLLPTLLCVRSKSASTPFAESQMRKHATAWAALDIRMMFQGYLERGFIAGDDDARKLTKHLGHEPRAYADFANETMREWQMLANPRVAA